MTTDNEPALQPPEMLRIQWCPSCGRDDRIQPLKAFHYKGGEICRGIPTTVKFTRARVVDGVPNHALVQLLDAALLHPESAEGYIRQVIESLSDGVVATVDQFNARIANYWPDWRKGSQAKVELMRAAWDAATRLANFNEMALKGCHQYTAELEKVQALAYQMAHHIRNTDEMPATQWGVQGMGLLEQLYNINPERYEHEVKAAATVPTATPRDEQPLEFKNTKEAMLYAQRNNMPAVIPVSSSQSPAIKAAEDPQDELVDEVQHRMDQVVEAAVEWHQAGREGGEWFEAAEKPGAAIDSLLELRSNESETPAKAEDRKS